MAKRLEDEGMPLAYHHHMGTVIESHQDTVRLLENTNDSVKLTLDTGHMLFAGGNSLKIIKEFGNKIVHVHCKDMRKKVLEKAIKQDLSFRHAFLEGAFTVPGDGNINFKEVVEALANNNYEGWFIVEAEQDPAKANPFEYAKIGNKELVECLGMYGYEIEDYIDE